MDLGYKRLLGGGDFKYGPRPDVGVLNKDGSVKIIEVASKTDSLSKLKNKNLDFMELHNIKSRKGVNIFRSLDFGQYFIPGSFFLGSVIGGAILALTLSMVILRLLAKGIKDKEWNIQVQNDEFQITFQDERFQFNLNDVIKIKNRGGARLRYFTLVTRLDKIKIRVGDTGLASFSTPKTLK